MANKNLCDYCADILRLDFASVVVFAAPDMMDLSVTQGSEGRKATSSALLGASWPLCHELAHALLPVYYLSFRVIVLMFSEDTPLEYTLVILICSGLSASPAEWLSIPAWRTG
jgi:hypothetical protein